MSTSMWILLASNCVSAGNNGKRFILGGNFLAFNFNSLKDGILDEGIPAATFKNVVKFCGSIR
jgi:hypothetical protein